MGRLNVVIPSIGRSDLLVPLVQGLLVDERIDAVDVVENQPGGRAHRALQLHGVINHSKLEYHEAIGTTIYKVWNVGMDATERFGPEAICVILNDDIILPIGACSVLARMMWDRPNYGILGFQHERDSDVVFEIARKPSVRNVRGTYRHHGIGGFAFAVRALDVPRVDERFVWWYGDDDLVNATLAAGLGVGVAEGIPVSHPHPSTSMVHHPEMQAAIAADAALYEEKWPGT